MWARLSAVVLFVLTVQPLAFSQQATPTLRLLGSVRAGSGGGQGVSAYKNLAFTGMPSDPGSAGSVAIVDISDPAAPVSVGQTPSFPNVGFEEHRALRIGHRDVLAVYLYDSRGHDLNYHTGLKLFDIGDPAHPQLIGTFDARWGGYHFEVTQQGNRTLALLSVLRLEAITSNYGQQPGYGDLIIVDISDPTNPVMVGEWGVIDEPALGLGVYLTEQRGSRSRDYGEAVWVSDDGKRAYYAYSDFGVMILDISNPSRPRFLGRVGYDADEQGDAHDVRVARDGSVLIRSSIVRWPFQTRISSNVFAGIRTAGEDVHTPAIYSRSGSRLSGEVVRVGSGCMRDAYLADPNGAIALIEDDEACGMGLKIGLAQKAGAIGVIVYKPIRQGGFSDTHQMPFTAGRFWDPDLNGWAPINVPAVAVGWNTGSCLGQVEDGAGHLVATDCENSTPVTIRAESTFSGYGRLDIFDISNPSAPVKLSTFGSPHAMDVNYALADRFPVSNPSRDTTANHVEVSGNTIYAGFWADGLRVIDISRPSAPREIASWTGQGASVGDWPLCGWEVVRHRGLILLNSLSHGLYILEDVR